MLLDRDEELWLLFHGMAGLPWALAHERMLELGDQLTELEGFYWALCNDCCDVVQRISAIVLAKADAGLVLSWHFEDLYLWSKGPSDDSRLETVASVRINPIDVPSELCSDPVDVCFVSESGVESKELADLATDIVRLNPATGLDRASFRLWMATIQRYLTHKPWIGVVIDPHKDGTYFVLFIQNRLPSTFLPPDFLAALQNFPYAQISSDGTTSRIVFNQNFHIF